ncbi:hypothetical protein IWW36_003802 [Coemansia brasiliensis]|uniref:Uncharacterized protein n=1 Tax=Coemansia brasiliensis TaxID=2650707 RepID=A0A9W8I751_9FUNG|nr:hypothetical protein IWW36_003802 [Coemansia brasiliensis]
MHFITLGSMLLLAKLAVGSKSSDAGIEFVKACDSGPDDVTNQCINRIPDDIGRKTGNHACAYHEAEVRCLGLCGNTMTWKVAYNNALKRYRLVCASYIDERIAEKEESGEAEDTQEEPPKRKKTKAAEPASEANDKEEDDDEGGESKKIKKQQSVKSSATPEPKSSQKATETAHSKPTSSIKQHSKSSSTSDSKAGSATKTTDSSASETSIQMHHSSSKSNQSKSKSKGGHAMLPTMDPELADSAPGSPGLAISSLLAAIVMATFY